ATEELKRIFFDRYEVLFKHLPKGMPVELLSWRLSALGPRPPVQFRATSSDGRYTEAAALKGSRRAYFGQASGGIRDYETPIYDRYALLSGMRIAGPAVVEERESTTVIAPGIRATVDQYQNLVVHL